MDLFQHRYYRLNKTLMTLIGQWPYQSSRARRRCLAIIIFLNTSQIIPLTLAIAKHFDDRRILLDGVLSILFIAIYATKFIGLIWNSQTTLKLVNRIRTDWQVWAGDQEVEILHKYAENGKKLIVVYTVMIYSTLFVFMTQPAISRIIDVLRKNGTESGKFPFPVDYYHLDAQKYYYYIIMYSCLCLCTVCMVLVASDVMFVTYVQHGCGLFAALGHKLERVGNYDTSVDITETPSTLDERDMLHLASCIDRHNNAIEYANLIENSTTWSFFFIIGFGMIQFNVSGLQILTRKSNSEEIMKFIIFTLSIMFIFIIYSYLSQILMDHSINIRFHIHNNQWYRLSVKVQKLLQLMMMRSNVPCKLTAGKILIMSMKSVVLTARTAISYFAFVRSTQGL